MAGLAPLVVSYSRVRIALTSGGIALMAAIWTWQGINAALAQPAGLRPWLTPVLGTILTLAFLAGSYAMTKGASQILRIDANGLTFPEAYSETVPWSAIERVARVRGRGIALEVRDGERFMRNPSRNLRPARKPGTPDIVFIRTAMLDHSPAALLSSINGYLSATRR